MYLAKEAMTFTGLHPSDVSLFFDGFLIGKIFYVLRMVEKFVVFIVQFTRCSIIGSNSACACFNIHTVMSSSPANPVGFSLLRIFLRSDIDKGLKVKLNVSLFGPIDHLY